MEGHLLKTSYFCLLWSKLKAQTETTVRSWVCENRGTDTAAVIYYIHYVIFHCKSCYVVSIIPYIFVIYFRTPIFEIAQC